MSKAGRRLICPTCNRNVGVNRVGNLIRHVRPNAVRFEPSCLGSNGPGIPATPAPFTHPVDGDPIIAMLCARREELGLLQRDVAAAAGCHTQHYGHIERGMTSPALRTLRGILAALDLELTVHSAGDPWRTLAEQREQQVERLTAKVDQLQVRAVAAEETVAEVRTQNRELRKEGARLAGSRDRVLDVGQHATRLQAELDQAHAGLSRTRAALDALARQPVLSHDLIDKARAAIAGRVAR